MRFLKKERVVWVMVLCAVLGAWADAYPGKRSFALEGGSQAQDLRILDRRISALEQRLYSIELSIKSA